MYKILIWINFFFLVIILSASVPAIFRFGEAEYFIEDYKDKISSGELNREESIDSSSSKNGEAICSYIADDFLRKLNMQDEYEVNGKELTRLVAFCLRKKGNNDIAYFLKINNCDRPDFSGSKKEREMMGYRVIAAIFPNLKPTQNGAGLLGVLLNRKDQLKYSESWDLFSEHIEKKYDSKYGSGHKKAY